MIYTVLWKRHENHESTHILDVTEKFIIDQSFPFSDEYVHVMACCLFRTMPLTEAMLTYP